MNNFSLSGSSSNWITGVVQSGSTFSVINANFCGTYVAPSGAIFTTAGTFQDIIPNSVGCDSVYIINLTINDPSNAVVSVSECDSYLSPLGNVYNQTGTYYDTLVSYQGCDSIIVTDLIINDVTYGSVSVTECDSYLSSSGNYYYSSGTYFETVTNSNGCDSVITIDLTIIESTSSIITTIECVEFLAPSGIIYSSTGVYTDIIPNSIGCDSVITIDLTIVEIDLSITENGNELWSNQLSANYQWLDCNNNFEELAGEIFLYYTVVQNGSYAVEVTLGNCVDTSECVVIDDMGVSALQSQMIDIYPIPVEDKMSIILYESMKKINVKIYNAEGKEIFVEEYNNSELLNIDFHYPAGVYYILLRSEELQYGQKIIKR